MELGVAKALELGSEFIVKIDGDDQFDSIDIENVLKIGQKNKSDFIKCDRFWPGGLRVKYRRFAILEIRLLFFGKSLWQ